MTASVLSFSRRLLLFLASVENVMRGALLLHSPLLALGFEKLAKERGAICYVQFPGHPSAKFKSMWDFLLEYLTGKVVSA